MKVMIHGAINLSNYGDYIFAEMFAEALKDNNVQVEFYSHPKYGISDYFAKYLNYSPNRKNYKRVMEECNALVFISGGYFVEPLKKGFISEHKRIHRYLNPAFYFMKHNKPIYILGVGAGPFENTSFSKKAKQVIEYAKIVTVRNEESKMQCNEFGIDRKIEVTADTALLIGHYLNEKKRNIPKFEKKNQKKVLLFHIDSNKNVTNVLAERVIPAVKKFLVENDEYQLYLAADGLKSNRLYDEYSELFKENEPILLKYDNPWKLTREIEGADLIVTTKLHMGIVGSVLGKSVVSFPFVPNKTKRFYKQIGEAKRCISLCDIDEKVVLQQLQCFKDKNISVPDDLISVAQKNLDYLPK